MDDDRILCGTCRNLLPDARCRSARSRSDVGRTFGPAYPELPRRCVYYTPKANVEDQRDGRARWPAMAPVAAR